MGYPPSRLVTRLREHLGQARQARCARVASTTLGTRGLTDIVRISPVRMLLGSAVDRRACTDTIADRPLRAQRLSCSVIGHRVPAD